MSKEITRQKLINSLKELMNQNEFETISVTQICDHAAINRRTFYRYFVDKYELLEYIFQTDFSHIFNDHQDWTISQCFPLFCKQIYQNREFYKKAFKISGQNGFREYSVSFFEPIIKRYAYSLFQSPAMYKRITDSFSYMTFDCFVDWLNTEPILSPEEFSNVFLHDLYAYYNLCAKQIHQSLDE